MCTTHVQVRQLSQLDSEGMLKHYGGMLATSHADFPANLARISAVARVSAGWLK